MKVPLKEIANIRTGHLFRSRIKYNNEGDKLVIRPVDMDNDTGEIDYINLKRISDDVSKDTILCENDIIIKAKGYNNVASRIKFSGISPSGPRFREHCQAANLDILSNFAPLTIFKKNYHSILDHSTDRKVCVCTAATPPIFGRNLKLIVIFVCNFLT